MNLLSAVLRREMFDVPVTLGFIHDEEGKLLEKVAVCRRKEDEWIVAYRIPEHLSNDKLFLRLNDHIVPMHHFRPEAFELVGRPALLESVMDAKACGIDAEIRDDAVFIKGTK